MSHVYPRLFSFHLFGWNGGYGSVGLLLLFAKNRPMEEGDRLRSFLLSTSLFIHNS